MVKINGQRQRVLAGLGECWFVEVLDYRQVPLYSAHVQYLLYTVTVHSGSVTYC